MMMTVPALLFVLLLAALPVQQAQVQPAREQVKVVAVSLEPVFNKQPLVLNEQEYETQKGEKVKFSTFRLYLSGLCLLQQGKVVWAEKDSYHLVDAEQPLTQQLQLRVPAELKFDALRLHLGIDSLTNVSGALGGDLDPTKGMYWAWNSGYINLKLEGSSPVCSTRHHAFQYHIGGYLPPYQTLQTVTLPLPANSARIALQMELAGLLQAVDLAAQPNLMIPGKEAKALAALLPALLTVRANE